MFNWFKAKFTGDLEALLADFTKVRDKLQKFAADEMNEVFKLRDEAKEREANALRATGVADKIHAIVS